MRFQSLGIAPIVSGRLSIPCKTMPWLNFVSGENVTTSYNREAIEEALKLGAKYKLANKTACTSHFHEIIMPGSEQKH